MIKAIIFDCFGVLAVDGWLPFKREHFGHDDKLMQEVTDLNKQCDKGMLDYDDYSKQIADMAGVTPEQFKNLMEHTAVDKKLLEFIGKELKSKYKIGLLSNVASSWLFDKFTKEQIAMFDELALSSQTGFVKPDPQAYQDVLDRLDVEPREVIFTDDQPRYCAAAEELGIKPIVYKSFDQFKNQLNEILTATI